MPITSERPVTETGMIPVTHNKIKIRMIPMMIHAVLFISNLFWLHGIGFKSCITQESSSPFK